MSMASFCVLRIRYRRSEIGSLDSGRTVPERTAFVGLVLGNDVIQPEGVFDIHQGIRVKMPSPPEKRTHTAIH